MPTMQFIRTNWAPLLVIVVGFATSLAIALAPFEFTYLYVIPDDSFYYFEIARNIVHGLGSTFDGVNLTNGYHPLWLLVLVPMYAYFSTPVVMDVAPIHAALALSAFLNAALGFALLAIVSRYTRSTWLKALALGTWFFNPFNIYAMSNGLETSLSLFLIALFIACVLRIREHTTSRGLILAGVVGGFMMLARLDNVLYFVMFLAWLLCAGDLRDGFRRAVVAGIPATIVVAPWLIWNYVTFGMLFTSASAATTIVNHQLIVQDHGPSIFQKLKAVVYMSDYTLRQIAMQTGAPSVFFVLLGVTAGWYLYAARTMRLFAGRIPLELFLFGGFVLNFIVNVGIRWSPREWYFIPLGIFIAMWVAWLLEKLRESGKLRTDVVIIAVCLVLSLYYISWSKNLRDFAERPHVLAATLWMNDNLPRNAVVGAFNAGVEGYFSTHRLINLDGLVNNHAYEALRDKRMWDYVKSEHIGYIADFKDRVAYRMKSFFGVPDFFDNLTAIHGEGSITVFKVQ